MGAIFILLELLESLGIVLLGLLELVSQVLDSTSRFPAAWWHSSFALGLLVLV